MIKPIILLLLIVATVHAGDVPEMTIKSAEQAVARFQKVRDTELKDSLTERQRDTLLNSSRMSGLSVSLLHPPDFQTYLKDPMQGDDNPVLRFSGTFAAAASSKNPTWHLDYHEFNHGGLVSICRV